MVCLSLWFHLGLIRWFRNWLDFAFIRLQADWVMIDRPRSSVSVLTVVWACHLSFVICYFFEQAVIRGASTIVGRTSLSCPWFLAQSALWLDDWGLGCECFRVILSDAVLHALSLANEKRWVCLLCYFNMLLFANVLLTLINRRIGCQDRTDAIILHNSTFWSIFLQRWAMLLHRNTSDILATWW